MTAVKRNPTAYAPLVPGSPEWQTHRRTLIGASEVPALFEDVGGDDGYRSLFDVWLDKTGKSEEEPRDPISFSAIGSRLERSIAELYVASAVADVAAIEKSWTEHDTVVPVLAATPDFDCFPARDADRSHTVQVKNRGGFPRGWGEPGTNQVPRPVLIQAHTEVTVTGKPFEDVAALLSGNRFVWYRVHRDADVSAAIRDRAGRFWHDHVLADVPPKITAAAGKYFDQKFARATVETIRVVDCGEEEDALRELARTQAAFHEAERDFEDAKAVIKSMVGEHKGLEYKSIGRVVWANRNGRRTISEESLRNALAAAFAPGGMTGVTAPIDHIVAQATKQGSPYRQFEFTPAK